MLKRIVIILSLMLFLSTSIFGYTAEEQRMINLIDQLVKGWETKDLDTIGKCFRRPLPDAQKKVYEDVFKIAKNIDLNYEVENVHIEGGTIGVVRVNISRTIDTIMNAADKTSERIDYYFHKMNNEWKMIGTVKPDLLDQPEQLIGDRLRQFEELINKNPDAAKYIKVNKDKPDVTFEKREINWTGIKGARFYSVGISKSKFDFDKAAEYEWIANYSQGNKIQMPVQVIDRLARFFPYYVHIIGFMSQGNPVGVHCYKIRIRR